MCVCPPALLIGVPSENSFSCIASSRYSDLPPALSYLPFLRLFCVCTVRACVYVCLGLTECEMCVCVCNGYACVRVRMCACACVLGVHPSVHPWDRLAQREVRQ